AGQCPRRADFRKDAANAETDAREREVGGGRGAARARARPEDARRGWCACLPPTRPDKARGGARAAGGRGAARFGKAWGGGGGRCAPIRKDRNNGWCGCPRGGANRRVGGR